MSNKFQTIEKIKAFAPKNKFNMNNIQLGLTGVYRGL
jgi:hypothetical protein